MGNIDFLIGDIKAKKELSNLENDFIMQKLKPFLDRNRKIREKLESSDYAKFRRSREHDMIIKEIRAQLRSVYGVFILDDYKKRHGLLGKLKDTPTLADHDAILSLHKSSKERLEIYESAYPAIFDITGKPKKIVDLACGLNPISYPYLGCRPEYVACDLSEKDLEFIDEYFRLMKIKGKTQRVDLLRDDVSAITKGADVTFLFKALDSLESVKRHSSDALLKSIGSRWIVASFATRSIGGRKEIRKEKRFWLDRMIERNAWTSQEIELPGEIFYVIKKA